MTEKVNYDDLYSKWENYIKNRKNVDGLKQVVLKSWKRCTDMGVNPYDKVALTDQKYEKKKNSLLEIASPIIDLANNLIQGTGFIIVLTDNDGFVIDIKGDKNVLQQAKSNFFEIGANRLEKTVGTNAIGLALIEDKPVQIVGPEHFNVNHHYWTCSAAPIHDQNGKIVGVLDLSGHRSLNHRHTLGMVVSLVQAIEKEFDIREKKRRIQLANQHLKAIINSISDGIIAFDHNGVITETNSKVEKLCCLDKSTLIGAKVEQIFGKQAAMLEVLKTGVDYSDHEEQYTIGFRKVECITTARLIKNEMENTEGVVVVFREKKKMHSMINRIMGAKANFTFADIIGRSPSLKNVIDIAKRVAETDTRVVLEGESGTGKELFAQSIHNASKRALGPFIAVNCSAIPRELIESELFGYSEGAFTGAKKGGKLGKFELADGGTLFLDEISSMSLEMQAKLLRALQQNEIVRVGGIETIPVDIRIIAASNQPLDELVKEGLFREDLFYRLGVVVIKIPPLRERVDDIGVLFSYLLEKTCKKMGYSVNSVKDGLINSLCAYSWPGNVREMENYVERAVVLAKGSLLTEDHFPKKLFSSYSKKPCDHMAGLAKMEKEGIEKTLEMHNGNISQTAKSLGITRNTLYNKLKEYEIKFNYRRYNKTEKV